MRALGLDLGTKRIGIAVSDFSGTIASPLKVLIRARRRADDHAAIAALVDEEEAECVVVGMPFSMDGTAGTAAKGAIAEVAALASVLSVPVETWDERLSTVTAHQIMGAGGKKAAARRDSVDKVAAAVILQGWLDHRRIQQIRQSDRAGD
jgi:putative holliday junction resolvase